MTRTNWSHILLRKLIDNPDMIKLYLIPGLLFLLDFVVRSVLGIDLIDAGADMALLSVATFISLLIEDTNPQQKYNVIKTIFIILFMSIWIISLRIVSIKDPMLFLSIDFRLVFSWFIGLTSFVFSGIMASEIVLDNRN